MAERANDEKILEELRKRSPSLFEVDKKFNNILIRFNRRRKQKSFSKNLKIEKIGENTWHFEGIEVTIKGDLPEEKKQALAEEVIRDTLATPIGIIGLTDKMTDVEQKMEIYRYYIERGYSPEEAHTKAERDFEEVKSLIEIMDGIRPLPPGSVQEVIKKGRTVERKIKGSA